LSAWPRRQRWRILPDTTTVTSRCNIVEEARQPSGGRPPELLLRPASAHLRWPDRGDVRSARRIVDLAACCAPNDDGRRVFDRLDARATPAGHQGELYSNITAALTRRNRSEALTAPPSRHYRRTKPCASSPRRAGG
jgi:hypothetical protein